jgi:glycosyltransferase involved in cell wall biosynthesis
MTAHPTRESAAVRAAAERMANDRVDGGVMTEDRATVRRGAVDVCMAFPRFHPDYAGAAVRFQRYAPGLADRGVRMRVFAASWASGSAAEGRSPAGRRSGVLLPPEEVDSIPVQRVSIARAGKRRADITYTRGLRRHFRGDSAPDVLNLFRLGLWAMPWLLQLRRLGVPLVYTATLLRDPAVSQVKVWPMRLAYGLMDYVVASTSVMRDVLIDEGVRAPIEVIPNGLDLERFRPLPSRSARSALRLELGLDPDAELIVFVGGFLNERKGVDVLADAWRILAPHRPRAQLALIGPHVNRLKADAPQAEFFRRVNASIDASGARDRVVSPGSVTNVEQYLQAADVFVFPSRREGMGNVVMEAFGCGVPAEERRPQAPQEGHVLHDGSL